MNSEQGDGLTTAKRLRAQAARARRLAKQIPGDASEKPLRDVAEELDAEATRLDGEPPDAAKE